MTYALAVSGVVCSAALVFGVAVLHAWSRTWTRDVDEAEAE